MILAIGGAFIVPRFIQWGDYRERLETMGTTAFGAPVTIAGDISLTLLPQPQLLLTKVLVWARPMRLRSGRAWSRPSSRSSTSCPTVTR